MRPMMRDSGRSDKRVPSAIHRSQSSDRERLAGKPYGAKAVEDGPMQPVNYSGTQVNIFGSPSPDYVGQALQQANSMTASATSGPNYYSAQYPYGVPYPPNGFTNQVQVGLMTEHMLRKLDEQRLLTMSELMRQAYGKSQPPPSAAPYVQEPLSPPPVRSHQALEYDARPKPVSPGNGDWRAQLKHIYSHLLDIANEDKNFRINIGEPKLGEIVAADLEEDDDTYSLTLKFGKPSEEERRKKAIDSIDRRPKTPASTDRRFGRAQNELVPERNARTPVSNHGVTRGGWGSRAEAMPSSDSRKSAAKRSPAESAVRKQTEREEAQFEKENIQQEGTLKPFKQFNAEADADALRKAMKGVGTDEGAITNILGRRSSSQRQEIIKIYKTLFGKDLVKDLKGELSGDYWKVIQALCLTHADYDATELRRAIKGPGTDDDAVIEIICTRTNKTLLAIEEAYKRLFNKNLEEDIIGDTSGHYQRLLVALLQANRDESNTVDRNAAKKDAQDIYNAGVAKWGTDESRFNAVLVRQSYAQLRATFKEYETLAGKSIEEAIKSEMSSDLRKGMLAIVQCIKNKPGYFAQKMYSATKGAGTDDDSLIRIIVSRCEVDMVQIKAEFQSQFKQSLAQFVYDDTSGDYRKILLTLLGESGAAKNS